MKNKGQNVTGTKSNSKGKTIAIIILAVIIVVESCVLIFRGGASTVSGKQPQSVLNLDTAAIADQAGTVVNDSLDKILSIVSADGDVNIDFQNLDLIKEAKKLVFSDLVVDAVMMVAYPLLYDSMKELGFLDFATGVKLYPTGPEMAELFADKAYTCYDKDGTQKSLSEVLTNVGDDWSYMSNKVTITTADGKEKAYSLWNTVKWNVTDEESFYRAMGDMFEPLRGIFEICFQGKSMDVSINLAEFVAGTSINGLDYGAAKVYNTEYEESTNGYEMCLIPLFNMLGLSDGDYPTVEEVKGYTDMADFWKAIFATVFKSIDRLFENDPVTELASLIVNFANAIETGELINSTATMSIDAEFGSLAKIAMGFEDGNLFSFGKVITDITDSIGINISGNLTDLFTSIMVLVTKDEADVAPQFEIQKLTSNCTATTLANGKVHYTANDAKAIFQYLVAYIIDIVK